MRIIVGIEGKCRTMPIIVLQPYNAFPSGRSVPLGPTGAKAVKRGHEQHHHSQRQRRRKMKMQHVITSPPENFVVDISQPLLKRNHRFSEIRLREKMLGHNQPAEPGERQ
jgi:hypothetical protein